MGEYIIMLRLCCRHTDGLPYVTPNKGWRRAPRVGPGVSPHQRRRIYPCKTIEPFLPTTRCAPLSCEYALGRELAGETARSPSRLAVAVKKRAETNML